MRKNTTKKKAAQSDGKLRGRRGLKQFVARLRAHHPGKAQPEGQESDVCLSSRTVTGNRLEHLGIFSGDSLICRETSEYTPGVLSVWQTPDGITAKFGCIQDDGSVVLYNKAGWEQQFKPGEVKLLEVVFYVESGLEVSR